MKKLNEYDITERKQIESEINAFGEAMGGEWEAVSRDPIRDDSYGLCNKCKEFLLTMSEYGGKYAYCYKWKQIFKDNRRVTECSGFEERGRMTLYDMKQIATIIEIPDKEIGFVK